MMHPTFARAAIVFALVLWTHNDGAGQVCLRGKQQPACTGYPILEFNAGGWLTKKPAVLTGGGRFAFHGTAGYAHNVASDWAVGGGLKAAADDDGARIGPAVRVRRWIAPRASLDVTAGVFTSGNDNFVGFKPGPNVDIAVVAGDLIGVAVGLDRVNGLNSEASWRSWLGARFGSWLAPIAGVGVLALAFATYD